MERLTSKQLDGKYHLYEISKIIKTTCCDESGKNAFDLYEGTAIDKLGAYEDAEEQGLLLRLPCKTKSIVYIIDHHFLRREQQPFKCEVDEFVIENNRCYAILNGCEPFYAIRRFTAVNITNFGITVFLTKEEAEQELAKMKEV